MAFSCETRHIDGARKICEAQKKLSRVKLEKLKEKVEIKCKEYGQNVRKLVLTSFFLGLQFCAFYVEAFLVAG